MKKTYYAAAMYAAFGLLSGLFYREYVKANDFGGDTQLALLHTHLFAHQPTDFVDHIETIIMKHAYLVDNQHISILDNFAPSFGDVIHK